MISLPNEILANIAQQCVEPYSLIGYHSGHSRGLYCYSDFKPMKNVQLTNKLFAIEVRKALRNKFNGRLVIDPDVDHVCIPKQMKDIGNKNATMITDLVKQIEIPGFRSGNSGTRPNIPLFPNLQRVIVQRGVRYDEGVSGMTSSTNVFNSSSQSYGTLEHDAWRHFSEIRYCCIRLLLHQHFDLDRVDIDARLSTRFEELTRKLSGGSEVSFRLAIKFQSWQN